LHSPAPYSLLYHTCLTWTSGESGEEAASLNASQRLTRRQSETIVGFNNAFFYSEPRRGVFGQEAVFRQSLPAVSKVVPKEMVEWFKSAEGRSFKNTISGDNAAPDAVMLQAFQQGPFRREGKIVAYLASKDVSFLFGTDTPSMPSYGDLPSLNGYLEMQQLQNAGMSLAQIFKAATINNAREFKLDSQIGTIEPGKIANLVC
jgi:hypothetical protein